GMTAAECGGIIHTEFERGFMGGEVRSYDEYVEDGGEEGGKEGGKEGLEGGYGGMDKRWWFGE
uniref:DUF933 domain-containing protein n=1 Tax=Staphylococcus haemolyticus TaxID=1283 RepID=UPI00119E6D7C